MTFNRDLKKKYIYNIYIQVIKEIICVHLFKFCT